VICCFGHGVNELFCLLGICSVDWQLVTDVSGQEEYIGTILKGQAFALLEP